jgi:catechol 2,3-dioxygenase-like lactoylglutathione lyase family enzyme
MNQVQVDQKIYQMPPKDGITVAHFLTVADIERSLRFYEKVFGGRILSRGDSKGAPGYIQIANTWLLVNPGGGPTPDKPMVTLSVPADPNSVSSFMNIRVADIQACYELWRSRGAEFITEPKPKYGETRCYIRDPDGYIIEIGQRLMPSLSFIGRAEQAASNAWLGADGGCICADAPNAVTSAAVILHQISMHRNITPLQVIR